MLSDLLCRFEGFGEENYCPVDVCLCGQYSFLLHKRVGTNPGELWQCIIL